MKVTFLVTVLLFFAELVVSFNQYFFFNHVVYISIFAIVILGYYDKYYMRFIIFELILTAVLDAVWLFVFHSVTISLYSLISPILQVSLVY